MPPEFDELLQRITANDSGLACIALCHAGLDDTNTIRLAESLATNSVVSCVRLDNNALGDASGHALGRMLASNRTITLLWIAQNRMGDAGGWALIAGLETNGTLTRIDVGHEFHLGREMVQAGFRGDSNPMSMGVMRQLQDRTARNRHFRTWLPGVLAFMLASQRGSLALAAEVWEHGVAGALLSFAAVDCQSA